LQHPGQGNGLRSTVANDSTTQVACRFNGLSTALPGALGEEVLVHGAIALARKKLG
jgi:hypothetical protein